jgi:hypothetical protein
MIDAKLGWTLCCMAALVVLSWWLWRRWRHVAAGALTVPAVRRRLLRPRTPADCPDCQQAAGLDRSTLPKGVAVRP